MPVVRVWVRASATLLVAAGACVIAWSVLSITLPVPVDAPRPGPALESLTPAQLTAMGVRLDPALQPAELPAWLTRLGARLPGTVVHANEAQATVRKNVGSFQGVTEQALVEATVTARGGRPRGPTIVRRLVWALFGARRAGGGSGAIVEVLWLVDARTGSQLTEIAVLPPPAGGPSASGP
jgi:hypothetical protein